MTTPKENKKVRDIISGTLDAIKGELLDERNANAIAIVKWFLRQVVTNKKHKIEEYLFVERRRIQKSTPIDEEKLIEVKARLKQVAKDNFPYNLKTGDIIKVNFGIGIGAELKDTHYALILSRFADMFLVAPLTSEPGPYNEHIIFFEKLPLPTQAKNGEEKSYVSFCHIRYVHSRRIEKISNLDKSFDGRIHLDKPEVDRLMNFFHKIVEKGQEI